MDTGVKRGAGAGERRGEGARKELSTIKGGIRADAEVRGSIIFLRWMSRDLPGVIAADWF